MQKIEKKMLGSRLLVGCGYVLCVLYVLLCAWMCVAITGIELGSGYGNSSYYEYCGFNWENVKWGTVAFFSFFAVALVIPWFRSLGNVWKTGRFCFNLLGAGSGVGVFYTVMNVVSAIPMLLFLFTPLPVESGYYSNSGNPLVNTEAGIGYAALLLVMFFPALIIYLIMSAYLCAKKLFRKKR